MNTAELLEQDFVDLGRLIHAHALERPHAPAIHDAGSTVDYATLSDLVRRVAASFRRDGALPGSSVAMCAGNSANYIAALLGAISANIVVCPLSPSLTSAQLTRMLEDCEAQYLFLDGSAAVTFADALPRLGLRYVDLGDGSGTGFSAWLAKTPERNEIPILPDDPFNIIYSSGTTGAPKGIVQSHLMRWRQIRMLRAYQFDSSAVTLLSTPVYSNTTLAALFPSLACGGCVVLLRKFEAREFLGLAQQHRVTHAMLVPVQYRRIMEVADFDAFDLSRFVMKFAASAPFSATLKATVLDRWPGGLVELYGATEGGGLCVLEAHAHPDKLGTVGVPYPGHDIRLIKDDDTVCSPGEAGEVVGRSGAMMERYHKDPARTAQAEWISPSGLRYIRMGDIGRFDTDGFLTIVDRKKDLIISGGFNVYPSDIESALEAHPAILEAAVVGIPSERWGETPVAFVALRESMTLSQTEITEFMAQRISKIQRPSAYHFVPALPRSTIGKVLKNALVDQAVSRMASGT
jgi:acyl-CoA synthetase (AMP-forming)/AMP-acid ligase II